MPTAYAIDYTLGGDKALASELWRGGPYEYGGFVYVVTLFTPLPSGSRTIRVSKSPDGINWTALDTANEMVSTTISGGHGIDSVRIGNVLHILGLDESLLTFELTTFDLATDTYGAVVTGGAVSSSSGASAENPGIFEVSASGARKVIAYGVDNGGIPTDIAFVVYDGTWHAPVTVANDSRQIRSIAIDASDRVHLVTYTSAKVYEEYIFDSSNVLTGPFTMYGPTLNTIGWTGPSEYDSATDTIRVPITEAWPGTGIQASVLEGTPSSAPVWTQDVAGHSSDFEDWIYPVYIPGTSPFLVIASDGGNAARPLIFLQKVSGTWGARTIIFEPMFDPAIPALSTHSGDYGTFRPLATKLASGKLAAVGGYPNLDRDASNTAYYVEFTPCSSGASSGNLYFAH